MQLFEVTWIVEIAAATPQEAADLAREMQLNRNSDATFFTVQDEAGKLHHLEA